MGGGPADGKSLEDLFYQKEMEMSKFVFTRQFTPAVVYAWLKLKEQVRTIHMNNPFPGLFKADHYQEIRNVTWISECIAQNQKERIGNFISVF
jgi:V-type H+-transporting ATPase subunit d